MKYAFLNNIIEKANEEDNTLNKALILEHLCILKRDLKNLLEIYIYRPDELLL